MDREFEAPIELPRNQASRRQHRRESLLQIGLPLALGILLLVTLPLWLVGSGAGEVGALAQIATMLLAVIGLVFGLLMLVMLAVGIYALARLMHWLPPQAYRAQRAIRQVNGRIIQASDLLAKPVLLLESWQRAAERVFRRRS